MMDTIASRMADDSPSNKAIQKEAGEGATPLPPQGTPINQYEVRGFEMAKLETDGSWSSVYKTCDTELARRQIIRDAEWFNSRGHGTYQARILVSCEMPRAAEPPLVLDADESPEAGGGLSGVTPDMEPEEVPPEVEEAMLAERAEEDRAELVEDDPISTPASDLGGEG